MGSAISNFIYSYFMRNLETNVLALDTNALDDDDDDVSCDANAVGDYYNLYMYIHDSDEGDVNADLKNMYKESSKNNNELVDKYLKCCEKNDGEGDEDNEDNEGQGNEDDDAITYCYNSGFDLFCPTNIECTHINKYMLDHNIACSMTYKGNFVGYYLYVRSSTPIKTPLRLANNVGIIDSGYRGNIKGCFDIIDTKNNFNFEKGNRYMQLCPPDIGKPMKVYIVDAFHNLGKKNNRYCGGFGSTGN
jgi:dUTP pyrophosphatase